MLPKKLVGARCEHHDRETVAEACPVAPGQDIP